MMKLSIGKTSAGALGALVLSAAVYLAWPSSDRVDQRVTCLSPEAIAPETSGMILIEGGAFDMGAGAIYAEERPVRREEVESFWIDATEVTNAEFAEFVEATGYVTVAEAGIEGVVPSGAAVFQSPTSEAEGRWIYHGTANWRHPDGPGSTIEGREHFPVVQIAFQDALAYAAWKDRALPTEIQWEYAARGGLDGATYAWGEEREPNGRYLANTWQGFFPFNDEGADGFIGRAPVGCYPPNGYGLFDMIGNVWEWTADAYAPPGRSLGLMKGGSYLCAPNYCRRYRPAARHPQEIDLGTDHIGFRTVSLERPAAH
jgi:formylglycine-generating enzyme